MPRLHSEIGDLMMELVKHSKLLLQVRLNAAQVMGSKRIALGLVYRNVTVFKNEINLKSPFSLLEYTIMSGTQHLTHHLGARKM